MSLEQLQLRIQPLREALLAHPLYEDLRSPRSLRTFMEHHVWAVWDFMSLLKALQQRLTCVAVPWLPGAQGEHARLINEIVLGEESDDDGLGDHASHFELYLRAMRSYGADTSSVERFSDRLRGGLDVSRAMAEADVPAPVRSFVDLTFAIIDSGDLCRIAAAFTFGREDLLPGVFQRIVDELARGEAGGLDPLKFYLLRHIALDGDEHGPMASRLVTTLCGGDESKWSVATAAACEVLEARRALWDAIRLAVNGARMDD